MEYCEMNWFESDVMFLFNFETVPMSLSNFKNVKTCALVYKKEMEFIDILDITATSDFHLNIYQKEFWIITTLWHFLKFKLKLP